MLDGASQGFGDGAAQGGEVGWGRVERESNGVWSATGGGAESRSNILLQDGVENKRSWTKEMDES